MVSDYNLDDKVTFAGYQSEVYNYLNIIDIFVLPSYYEGFPIALLESMLSGKITIATNVNGVPELIEDNINGFLFNPGDVAKLKIILHNIITDYPRYKYISSNAKLRVEENFLMSNFINDIQKIYIEEACKN